MGLPPNPFLILYSTSLWWLIRPTLSGPTSLFLLAGQSNMSGRGGVLNTTGNPVWDNLVPDQCSPSTSILRLDARLHWVEAREPLHHDIDYNKTCGVGPGMSFAHTVFGHGPGLTGVVGLVPCAIGGTVISQWARGSQLYRNMMRRARSSARYGGSIEALIWYQGESDTEKEEDAISYGEKLVRFLSDVRADLQDPLLPIIVVAIGSGSGQYIEKVREAQLDIDLLNVRVVDAMGLPLGPDNLHLTTEAQVHLGEMLGRAYLKFLPSPIQRNVAHNASPSTQYLNTLYHTFWTFILGVTLTTFFNLDSFSLVNL